MAAETATATATAAADSNGDGKDNDNGKDNYDGKDDEYTTISCLALTYRRNRTDMFWNKFRKKLENAIEVEGIP
jgi:hypothetical protein